MVTNEEASSLIRAAPQLFRGDVRKQDAYERWLVYEEAYPALVAGKIAKTHDDRDTIARMLDWVDVSCNLALDILPQICVCWKNGAKREVRQASDRQNGKIRDLYVSHGVDALTPEWNAQGYYFTELLVMPQISKSGDLMLHTALPHMYEPIPDPDNPMRDAGYLYTTDPRVSDTATHVHGNLSPARNEVDYVIVDDVGWRRYDGRNGELLDSQEHGLGYVPSVRLNFHRSFGGHRWAHSRRVQRLHDATLAASLVNTTMNFVRKAQNRQLFVAAGQLDDASNDGHTPDPETGMAIQADSPQAISVQTLNFDTDPGNFIKQIQWIYQSAAQSYGGFAIMDPSTNTSAPQFGVEFSYDAQAETRDRQLPEARRFERELMATIVDVMRAGGHRDAGEMPDSDKVRESLSVDFGNLSRRFANPREQKEYFEFLKANGAMTQIDLVRSIEGATLDDSKVKEIIEKNIEIQSWFNDQIASRNMLMGGEGITTASQAFGAMGPEVRDSQQPEDEEKAEDSAED